MISSRSFRSHHFRFVCPPYGMFGRNPARKFARGGVLSYHRCDTVYAYLFFVLFFVLFFAQILSSLLFLSLPPILLIVVTQIRGTHGRLSSSLLATAVRAFIFIATRLWLFFPSSTRVEMRLPTLRTLSTCS